MQVVAADKGGYPGQEKLLPLVAVTEPLPCEVIIFFTERDVVCNRSQCYEGIQKTDPRVPLQQGSSQLEGNSCTTVSVKIRTSGTGPSAAMPLSTVMITVLLSVISSTIIGFIPNPSLKR